MASFWWPRAAKARANRSRLPQRTARHSAVGFGRHLTLTFPANARGTLPGRGQVGGTSGGREEDSGIEIQGPRLPRRDVAMLTRSRFRPAVEALEDRLALAAQAIGFTIDPASSTLSLSGTLTGPDVSRGVVEPGARPLTTSFTGEHRP